MFNYVNYLLNVTCHVEVVLFVFFFVFPTPFGRRADVATSFDTPAFLNFNRVGFQYIDTDNSKANPRLKLVDWTKLIWKLTKNTDKGDILKLKMMDPSVN